MPETTSATKTATLTFNDSGKSVDLPIIEGSVGPEVIDVRRLYADTGYFTYDPGFTSTASCTSNLTYIDGEEGILMHRGYRIEDLAENCDFMEVCYLLLHGELPDDKEKDQFVHNITYHTMLHEQMMNFFRGFRRDSHPMAIMVGVVGALSAFYHDSTDISDPQQRIIASHRLLAKMPTIAAMAYKYSMGQPFAYPRNDLNYAENFLHMMFYLPTEEYKVSPTLARAMDRILILHADHEQNASTSTVRIAGSSGANPFACIAAGIASLWGPAHGGANEAVLQDAAGDRPQGPHPRSSSSARRTPTTPSASWASVTGSTRTTTRGPTVLRKSCHEVLGELGFEHDPLLELAVAARADRSAGQLLHGEEALPQRRLLLRHHPAGHGLPDLHVHRALRRGTYRGLGRPVARDDCRP